MRIEDMLAWKGRRHCEHILRENAWAEPCPLEGFAVFFDEDGVGHAFCPKHVSAGIVESSRKRWSQELSVAA